MEKPNPSNLSRRARAIARRFTGEFNRALPNWEWRIDGVALAVVLVVLVLDRTSVKNTVCGPWMNVVALYSVGALLHRNTPRRRNGSAPRPGLLRRLINLGRR